MLRRWRVGGWGTPGRFVHLVVILATTAAVHASFRITKVTLDRVQSIELSNEGGEILPQVVKAYVSTSGSTLTPEEFDALTPSSVISLPVTLLPPAGASKEFSISTFQVPEPEEVCGQYFLIVTLTEGQGSTPYFQFPVSRTKDCQEDVDLKWSMEGSSREFILYFPSDKNAVSQGATSSISITNVGNTDLAIRSATDAPVVSGFLASASAWQIQDLFSNPGYNYTLEMAVNEAIILELTYWLENGITNSMEIDGLSTLLVDLENARSLPLPIGDTLEVKFADFKTPAIVQCHYNLLVLVIDPYEQIKDSNRKNNYFIAPVSVGCGSGNDGCEVMANAKSMGREAMLLSWNYGSPTGYMFVETNGRSGFSPIDYSEMKTKRKNMQMVQTYAKRLTELGLCPTADNEAETAVDNSIAMKMLRVIRKMRTSLAELTVTNEESIAEHNKVLKMLELEEALWSLTLDKDGPLRFIMMKTFAKQIKTYVQAMLVPGGMFSQLGQHMGVDFSEILDLKELSSLVGTEGPDGTGAPGGWGRPVGPGYPGMVPPMYYPGMYPPPGSAPGFPGGIGPDMGNPESGGSESGAPESGGPETGGPGLPFPGMGDIGTNDNETGDPGMLPPSMKPEGMGDPTDGGGSPGDDGDGDQGSKITEQKPSCPTVECLAYGVFSCISEAWICDGNNDCKDGEDETNCEDAGAPTGTGALHKDQNTNIFNTQVEEAFNGLHREPSGGPFGGAFPRPPPPFLGNFSFNASAFNWTAFFPTLPTLTPPPPPPPFNASINGTNFVVGQNGTHFYININGTTYAVPINGSLPPGGVFPGPGGAFPGPGGAFPGPGGAFPGPGGAFPEPGGRPGGFGGFPGPGGFGRPGRPGRPGRGPQFMHSEKLLGSMWHYFKSPSSPGQDGGHHAGHGKGKKGPLKQMMMKLFLRLASGASAADLDELSFLDLQTRQLIKDVYDMAHEGGPSNLMLPYEVVIANGTVDPFGMFMQHADQHVNPSEVSSELFVPFLDFVKENVSVTVREMVQDNQTLTALLDLSLLYVDVVKANADELVGTIMEALQLLMIEPKEISLLMKMPGPEPTEEMQCMRKAEEDMALKNPEKPKKKAVKFFHDPLAEILEAKQMKNSKPCFWRIEDGAVFRGERSTVTGIMFWEKVALCNCNNQNSYDYWQRPSHEHDDHNDDDDDDLDLWSFIFGRWNEGSEYRGSHPEPQPKEWYQGGPYGGWNPGERLDVGY